MKTQPKTLDDGSRTCVRTEPLPGRKPVLALLKRLLWAAALGLPAYRAQAEPLLTTLHSFHPLPFGASAGVVLTTLHSFQPFPNGANPEAGLAQGSDGNFYGTTSRTVFQMTPAGVLTTLVHLGSPSGLVQGSDGDFYGTTSDGGTNNSGTVFKITTNGAVTSLHSFTGGNDGANPNGLVQGSDGYFYGATAGGGTNGYGTVFKIRTNGALTSLYSFTGSFAGAHPNALVQGSDGDFYGTTQPILPGDGCRLPCPPVPGTVFKISTNGALTTLHTFTSGNDGGSPQAALVQGSDGDFYGTTSSGGTHRGLGTVFRMTADGTLTTLHTFTSGSDGWGANALVQGTDGKFYGTTFGGGTNGYGTVFKINTNGAFTSLYSFTGGNDGANPQAALVQGSDGYFFGATPSGGVKGCGTVFKISTNGAMTILYSFKGGNDGTGATGLIQGSDGSFYGTTYSGGAGGFGTVFRLTIVPTAPAFQAVALNNSTLSLTWSTETGRTYQLQYTSDLSSTNWTNLGSPLTATGATLSATDFVTNGSRRFYRVVLAP